MKSRLFGLALLAVCALCRADQSIAAPPKLDDVVIRMTYVIAPKYWSYATQRWLHADGTYQDLIDILYADVREVGRPENGTYTYVASGSTATLVFEPSGSVTPNYRSVTLSFDTATTGHLSGDVKFEGYPQWAKFTLRPASRANGPLNVSSRSYVAPGNPAVVGCVVDTDQPRVVLIRAIGPSLTKFGVSSPIADPYFELHSGSLIPYHVTGISGWLLFQSPEAVTSATALTGAFPVDLDAGDSFEVAELPAGSHTIVAGSESGNQSGPVLVEVYFLP